MYKFINIKLMDKFSFLGSAHSSMIEEMYLKYLTDPKSINHTSDFFQDLICKISV